MPEEEIERELNALMDLIKWDWEKGEYNKKKVVHRALSIRAKHHIPVDQILLELASRVKDDDMLRERILEHVDSLLERRAIEERVKERRRLKESGEKRERKGAKIIGERRAVSDEELVKKHAELAEKLGRPPTEGELSAALGGRISPTRALSRITSLGLAYPKFSSSTEEEYANILKEEHEALKKKLGRLPTKEELYGRLQERGIPPYRLRGRKSLANKTLKELEFYTPSEALYHDLNKNPRRFLKEVFRQPKVRRDYPVIRNAFESLVVDLARDLGRIPTKRELAGEIGISVNRLSEFLRAWGLSKEIPSSIDYKRAQRETRRIREMFREYIQGKRRGR